MEENRSRSFFWPALMIAVGVIWLLGNLNIGLPPFNFFLLLNLWPLLLVVGGINLIIGRRWPLLRAAIVLLAVAGALAYVYLGPAYGLAPTAEVKHAEFFEPLNGAETATIVIDSSIGHVTLFALSGTNNLFEAEIDYVGEVTFEAEGESDRTIRLDADAGGFESDLFDAIDEDSLSWTIGISPDVPVTLSFSSGVGEFDLDLTGLTIAGVSLNSGVGKTQLLLPAQEGVYDVRVDGGVGQLLVTIADGAEVNLRVDGGVGEIVIDVPEDAGVEVSADMGVGNVNVPGDYQLVSGGSQPIATSGRWESPNFDEADYRIEIDFDGGVGNLVIK